MALMEKYDAFISYSHAEDNAEIAEALHKKLEHYRIPSQIQKITGKKKIERVFRDKEELPLSANLTENIYTALDNSEYLIVLCSPESRASQWVQREIEYFAWKRAYLCGINKRRTGRCISSNSLRKDRNKNRYQWSKLHNYRTS